MEAKNLSQSDIAQKLDVSQNAYNKWESDKSKPSVENLLKITDFYDTDIYDLLSDVSNINLSGSKFSGNNIVGNPSNSTFYNYPPELFKDFKSNQEQITKLIETQNKLIETMMKK